MTSGRDAGEMQVDGNEAVEVYRELSPAKQIAGCSFREWE